MLASSTDFVASVGSPHWNALLIIESISTMLNQTMWVDRARQEAKSVHKAATPGPEVFASLPNASDGQR